LIVLDELERIAAPFEDVLESWLQIPSVRILATSRAPLGVTGGARFEVQPLSPTHALAMLVDRSGLPEAEVASMADRCDGLPLALELTAGAARSLPIQPAPLHDALLGAVARSWRLLDPAGRDALTACTVFRGGFDLEAAEAVIGADAAGRLHRLRTLGLLHRTAGRLRVLNSLREAIATLGGDPAEARARHLAYYRAVVSGMDRFGPERGAVLSRLIQDRDELEAAIDEALRREDAETAAILVIPYRYALRVRTGEHAIRLLERVIEAAESESEAILTATAHLYMSRLSHDPGASTDALFALYDRAKALEMPSVVALCATDLGRMLFLQGRYEASNAMFMENLQHNGPPRLMARIALGMSKTARVSGRPAMPWLEQALAWIRPPDRPPVFDPPVHVEIQLSIGRVLQEEEQLEAAREHFEEALHIAEADGRVLTIGPLSTLGHIARVLGDFDEAQRLYEDLIERCMTLNAVRPHAHATWELAVVYIEQQNPLAEALVEEAIRLNQPLGVELESSVPELRILHALNRGDIDAAEAALQIRSGLNPSDLRRVDFTYWQALVWFAKGDPIPSDLPIAFRELSLHLRAWDALLLQALDGDRSAEIDLRSRLPARAPAFRPLLDWLAIRRSGSPPSDALVERCRGTLLGRIALSRS
ncbi:MAG: tetratricopeptide repeat protein, partial [Myxococcota bacterium]